MLPGIGLGTLSGLRGLRAARWFASLALAAAYWMACHGPANAQGFSFETVAEKAKSRASSPYKPAPETVPAKLLKPNFTYDQHRDIRFRPDRARWRADKLPFELMFFHLGWLFTRPVMINEVVDGKATHVAFDGRDFDYGKNAELDPREFSDMGFAGVRVHYPLNNDAYKDELIVFLGASYFRAVSRGARYGLSARALAIDTVGGRGEEFPQFVEFWFERPAPDAKLLTVYALLDSPHAAGAYKFTVTPGDETVIDVRSRLYLRGPVATLGIAPLTSMFFSGENQQYAGDFRPEVHDSDGLAIHSGNGEWIWRPLVNPNELQVTSFATTSPRGFGLMQRDRAFTSYEDLEARYELRPSAWIEPIGDWGAGRVELVQFRNGDETDDNAVAYWVPAKLPAAGQPLDLSYRMRWQLRTDTKPPQSWVTQTRRGHGYTKTKVGPDEFHFVLDFDGPALRAMGPAAAVQAVFTADKNAQVLWSEAFPNEATGGWRAALRFKRLDANKPVELRAFLRNSNETVSETWSYLLPRLAQ